MESVLNTIGHAVELSDGRPVLPGEVATNVEVDPEADAYNAGLVDDGTLLVLSSGKSKSRTAPALDDPSKGAAQ